MLGSAPREEIITILDIDNQVSHNYIQIGTEIIEGKAEAGQRENIEGAAGIVILLHTQVLAMRREEEAAAATIKKKKMITEEKTTEIALQEEEKIDLPAGINLLAEKDHLGGKDLPDDKKLREEIGLLATRAIDVLWINSKFVTKPIFAKINQLSVSYAAFCCQFPFYPN